MVLSIVVEGKIMRFEKLMLSAVAAMLVASPALAEPESYADPLRDMLTQTAAGTCPEAVMAEKLLAACRAQLPAMGPGLAALGPITGMTLVKAEGAGATRMETYKVTFAMGQTAVWHIGGLSGGKFEAAYSIGDK